ncbi:MAG: hypothetical protein J5693_01905 [Bacteroidales bacterium]|nr:hypothetical protein [Bacteroidales bacterium]
MKKILLPIIAMIAIVATSCEDYKTKIEEMQSKVDALSGTTVTVGKINAGVAGLQKLVATAQSGDLVKYVTPGENCYVVTFKNAGNVEVFKETSNITVGESGGKYFWKVGGDWVTDASGAKVPVATALKFKVEEYALQMSADGGNTWTPIPAVDTQLVTSVTEDAAYVTFNLLGGTALKLEKHVPLAVSFSGDGSTLAAAGRVVVEYVIKGETGSYTVTPVAGEGWKATVTAETPYKGAIEFVAPADAASNTVTVMVSDGMGHMVTSEMDLAVLTVKEDFPVMYPTWEAYSIGCDGGTVEVDLNTNLEYEVAIASEAASWLTAGGTKAVRVDKIAFTATANESFAYRSALVTFTAGDYVKTVAIWQEGQQQQVGTNLSENGTANCYIITGEGDYYFDATVAGCGESGIVMNGAVPADDFPATSLLEPASTKIQLNQNGMISNVRLSGGKIYFHASGVKGNASISVSNNRYVIWSWHIWCTDMPRERTHTNPDMLQFTVLDRNLGAISANPADGEDTYGLYYQWGRKDPFEYPCDFQTNSSHAFAFASRYPLRPFSSDGNADGNWYTGRSDALWGNIYYQKSLALKDIQKSIYDPCPVGYMVAPSNAFLILADESRTEVLENGFLVHGDYGQTNFYPFAGRQYRGSTRGEEFALWHSTAGRYGYYDDAGGCETLYNVATGIFNWYYGDMRVRAIPVRCVKQVNE